MFVLWRNDMMKRKKKKEHMKKKKWNMRRKKKKRYGVIEYDAMLQKSWE